MAGGGFVRRSLSRTTSAFSNIISSAGETVEYVNYRLRKRVDQCNKWADSSRVGRAFQFRERRAKLSTELRAGTITFLMVAYILAVNPQILGSTGGTCDAQALCSPAAFSSMGQQCLFKEANEASVQCLETLKLNLITATAASSLIACFLMGYLANMPVALAPGMGINIYVAYQIVGQGDLTYQQALAAIFVEGWIFLVLSLTGVRGGIIRYMPRSISFATSVGIGLLLAFTGLRNLGVVVFNDSTLVTLGGCNEDERLYVYTTDQAIAVTGEVSVSSLTDAAPTVYGCAGHVMRSATMWLGIGGGVLMALLMSKHVKGALFIGIAFITVISWIPGHAASYLGAGSSTPGGAYRLDLFKQVVAAPSLTDTGFAWDWSAFGTGRLWLALFTFLYIDLLDCTGTLVAMAGLLDDVMREEQEQQGRLEPYKPFLSATMEFPGQMWAFMADGCGILVGAMMGVTPLTVYIESAAGIEDGGRTGITAITISLFFFVSLFFSPILASIPPYATGPALVLVGVLLISHVDKIAWDDYLESIPAFLTIIMMPFTTSVAYGLLAGLSIHLMLHIPVWAVDATRALYRQYLKRRGSEGEASEEGGREPPTPGSSGSSRRRIYHVRKAFDEMSRSRTAGSDDGAQLNGGGFRTRYEVEGGVAPAGPGVPPLWVHRAGGASPPPSFRRMQSMPPDAAYGSRGPSPAGSIHGGGSVMRVQSAATAGGVREGQAQSPFYGGALMGLRRSRTFNDLSSSARDSAAAGAAEADAADAERPRSAHGGSMFKLFPEITTMSSEVETAAPKHDIMMFGEQSLLSLDLDRDSESLSLGAGSGGPGSRPVSPDLGGFQAKEEEQQQQQQQGTTEATGASGGGEPSRSGGMFASASLGYLAAAPLREAVMAGAALPPAPLPPSARHVGWTERGVSRSSPDKVAPAPPAGKEGAPGSLRRVETAAEKRLRDLFASAEEASPDQPSLTLGSADQSLPPQASALPPASAKRLAKTLSAPQLKPHTSPFDQAAPK